MKKLLFVFVIISCNWISSYGQKTFLDSNGDIYEIKEFKKAYSIDSCLIIEKMNTGWTIPTLSQFRCINSQWFGENNTHIWIPDPKNDYYQNPKEKYPVGLIFGGGKILQQDIIGGTFFTSHMDNIEKVEGVKGMKLLMGGKDVRVYYAEDENSFGYKQLYNFMLIRKSELKDSLNIDRLKVGNSLLSGETELFLDRDTEFKLNDMIEKKLKLKKGEFVFCNWNLNVDKEGKIINARPITKGEPNFRNGSSIINSYVESINNLLINQKIKPFTQDGKTYPFHSIIYISVSSLVFK